MTTMASQITSLTVVYSFVYSDADQRKHQSSSSLAFVPGIHRGPVNSPHKWPVTRKMFPFDDVIMIILEQYLLRDKALKISGKSALCSSICSGHHQRKHHSTTLFALCVWKWGILLKKEPVARKSSSWSCMVSLPNNQYLQYCITWDIVCLTQGGRKAIRFISNCYQIQIWLKILLLPLIHSISSTTHNKGK